MMLALAWPHVCMKESACDKIEHCAPVGTKQAFLGLLGSLPICTLPEEHFVVSKLPECSAKVNKGIFL